MAQKKSKRARSRSRPSGGARQRGSVRQGSPQARSAEPREPAAPSQPDALDEDAEFEAELERAEAEFDAELDDADAEPIDDASGDATEPLDADAAEPLDEVPAALGHASPDAELAEVQLAAGRAGFDADADADADAAAEPPALEFDDDEQEPSADGDGGADDDGFEADDEAPVPARAGREHSHNRVVGFVQGSWQELQRVKWPDRRQVIQFTGVVLGFVIIAGAFLGLCDLVAKHVVNFILTGHFSS